MGKSKNRRVPVTGKAGFIGCFLVESLLERRFEVVFTNNFLKCCGNLTHLEDDIEIEHDLSKPIGTGKYSCDMTKIKTKLGREPTTPIEEGLQEVYEWAVTGIDMAPIITADSGSLT
jgi:nucleoside-diphosphate-sugar epimerase